MVLSSFFASDQRKSFNVDLEYINVKFEGILLNLFQEKQDIKNIYPPKP